ncbi:hypothetical protein HS1genome_1922 [Sulfodiicoccus acidiphilus]|nr:hypothetical protein HS1genome_1922 [Sulfodiicoccus acidiphilus]
MPVTLQELVEVVSATKGADLVVANRKFVGFPNLRKFLHHAFIVTTKAFFPSLMDFSDFQAGLKVMKSSKALEVLDELVINDWLFDVNLIYSFVRRGYKVVEVPVTWVHKDGGKVSGRVVKTATMMFLSLVKLRTYYSPARWVLRTRLYRRAEAWLQRVLR